MFYVSLYTTNSQTFIHYLLLFLFFICLFSILGMNLFGCKFCRRNPIDNTMQCDRKNFDSLLWALVTVFQVSSVLSFVSLV